MQKNTYLLLSQTVHQRSCVSERRQTLLTTWSSPIWSKTVSVTDSYSREDSSLFHRQQLVEANGMHQNLERNVGCSPLLPGSCDRSVPTNPDLGKPTTKEYNAWLNTKLKHRQVSYVLKICNKLTADRKKPMSLKSMVKNFDYHLFISTGNQYIYWKFPIAAPSKRKRKTRNRFVIIP